MTEDYVEKEKEKRNCSGVASHLFSKSKSNNCNSKSNELFYHFLLTFKNVLIRFAFGHEKYNLVCPRPTMIWKTS